MSSSDEEVLNLKPNLPQTPDGEGSMRPTVGGTNKSLRQSCGIKGTQSPRLNLKEYGLLEKAVAAADRLDAARLAGHVQNTNDRRRSQDGSRNFANRAEDVRSGEKKKKSILSTRCVEGEDESLSDCSEDIDEAVEAANAYEPDVECIREDVGSRGQSYVVYSQTQEESTNHAPELRDGDVSSRMVFREKYLKYLKRHQEIQRIKPASQRVP